jgi:hypothetical protein
LRQEAGHRHFQVKQEYATEEQRWDNDNKPASKDERVCQPNWFCKNAITNIFALSNVIKQDRVTYDSDDKTFIVHRQSNGLQDMEFRMHHSGLNYFDPRRNVFTFISTVYGNKEGFTKRKIKDAEVARTLNATLSYPVHEESTPRNSQLPRTQGSSGNLLDGFKFITLGSGQKIVRRSWDAIPMPDIVTARVNALGTDQPEQLIFTDRHGRLIGDFDDATMDGGMERTKYDIDIPGVVAGPADIGTPGVDAEQANTERDDPGIQVLDEAHDDVGDDIPGVYGELHLSITPPQAETTPPILLQHSTRPTTQLGNNGVLHPDGHMSCRRTSIRLNLMSSRP